MVYVVCRGVLIGGLGRERREKGEGIPLLVEEAG